MDANVVCIAFSCFSLFCFLVVVASGKLASRSDELFYRSIVGDDIYDDIMGE